MELLMGKFPQIFTELSYQDMPIFSFQTITCGSNKGFSPNLLYALTLRRSVLKLLMGNFVKFVQSYLPETRLYFRFWTIT